jgi:hypothetical protein
VTLGRANGVGGLTAGDLTTVVLGGTRGPCPAGAR